VLRRGVLGVGKGFIVVPSVGVRWFWLTLGFFGDRMDGLVRFFSEAYYRLTCFIYAFWCYYCLVGMAAFDLGWFRYLCGVWVVVRGRV